MNIFISAELELPVWAIDKTEMGQIFTALIS
jgi:hypothetical protein